MFDKDVIHTVDVPLEPTLPLVEGMCDGIVLMVCIFISVVLSVYLIFLAYTYTAFGDILSIFIFLFGLIFPFILGIMWKAISEHIGLKWEQVITYITIDGKRLTRMKIVGIDSLTLDEIINEIDRGGKFVRFYWTCSTLMSSVSMPSRKIYFVNSYENPIRYGWRFALQSILFGWESVFFISAIISTIVNVGRSFTGFDVTDIVLSAYKENK